MTATFVWLGVSNLRLLRSNLEATLALDAQSLSNVIFRATRSAMLENNRSMQVATIQSIGAQPGVRRVRILSTNGVVQYSTDSTEIGQLLADTVARRPTFRTLGSGKDRMMELLRPIENEPACSNAACHAHRPSEKILGVLDVALSLEPVDRNLASYERQMRSQVVFAGAVLIIFSTAFVWMLVNRPVRKLIAGVQSFGRGNLAFRFDNRRQDEFGELARTFDNMAHELETANRTLEQRIEEKTKALKAAQEKLIHSEKLSSLGQLAGAVAHEINNPLAAIRTYARLVEKKVGDSQPVLSWSQTIQQESRRCGEIVSNLLAFARKQQTARQPADLRALLDRIVAVVRHKLDLHGIELRTEIGEFPRIMCDASQIEQVLLAIVINAIEAMGTGGKLAICGRLLTDEEKVDVSITNNGPPIPPEVMPKIFEPFFSTKQASSGVGLGLAVAYGIVQRHGGEIVVETGEETTFHVLLPSSPSDQDAVTPAPIPASHEVFRSRTQPATSTLSSGGVSANGAASGTPEPEQSRTQVRSL